MSAYGEAITRTLKAHRSMRDAGLEDSYETAQWRETASRVDRWILWMCCAAIPLCALQLYWRI